MAGFGTPPPGIPQAPGTLPGQGLLDTPPPSPAVQTGLGNGVPLGNLVPPLSPSQPPPEMLAGMLGVGDSIAQALDSVANAMPQLAPDVALAKDACATVFAKLQQVGARPMNPVATGPSFPGGGFDKGGMPAVSGGIG